MRLSVSRFVLKARKAALRAHAMNVVLVDGTYELFRAFFGAPSAKVNGIEVGATRALARSFAAMLRDPEVTHVACAFDTVIESFRNQMFDGYKTGDGIDPALYSQFPLAERVTEAMGIVTWRMIDHEADDALSTAAHAIDGDARVTQVRIASPDKDLLQCVRGDRVVSFDRRKKIALNDAGVREKMGVPPASIPDYLALVGDTADGIPGIPRWGARSTAVVLARYGHLENIPDDAKEWDVEVRGKAELAARLREGRPQAELYRRLATLVTDAPIDARLEQLEWRGPVTGAIDEIAREIGDENLTERLHEGA